MCCLVDSSWKLGVHVSVSLAGVTALTATASVLPSSTPPTAVAARAMTEEAAVMVARIVDFPRAMKFGKAETRQTEANGQS